MTTGAVPACWNGLLACQVKSGTHPPTLAVRVRYRPRKRQPEGEMMGETAQQLIAKMGKPTKRATCHVKDCLWKSGLYYNPGDARASAIDHMRRVHNTGYPVKADPVDTGARVRNPRKY